MLHPYYSSYLLILMFPNPVISFHKLAKLIALLFAKNEAILSFANSVDWSHMFSLYLLLRSLTTLLEYKRCPSIGNNCHFPKFVLHFNILVCSLFRFLSRLYMQVKTRCASWCSNINNSLYEIKGDRSRRFASKAFLFRDFLPAVVLFRSWNFGVIRIWVRVYQMTYKVDA